MSQEIASAFVRIRPNMSGFQPAVESGVHEGLSNISKIVGVAFGAVEAVKFGKDLIGGAAQLQKSTEVIRDSFGGAAAAVVDFGEKGAAAFGISAQAADATSAKFGILFKNIGVGPDLAAKMTVGFEQLAGALSSIKGVNPSEVLDALSGAAAGNTRGLKQLGFVVTDTTERIAAYKLGLISSIKEGLTPAQKSEAIYALVTQNLGGYLQQAAAHANDAADVQARLSAEWSNAKDELGEGLLPVVVTVTKFFADNLPGAIDVTKTAVTDLVDVFKDAADLLSPIFKPVIDEIGRLRDAIQFNGGVGTGIAQLKFDFDKLSDAGKGAVIVIAGIGIALAGLLVAAFPITATVLAVAGLAIAFKEAYDRSAEFRDIVGQVGKFATGTLVPALESVAQDLAPVFEGLYKVVIKLKDGFEEVAGQAGKVKDAFKGGFGSGLEQIKKSFEGLGPAGKIVVGIIAGITVALVAMVAAAFPITATVLAIVGLGIAFKEAYDHSATFRKAVDDVASFITGTLIPAVESIGKKLGPDFAAFAQLAKTAFGDVVQIVTVVFQDLKTIVGGAIEVILALWGVFGGTITTIIKNDFGGAVEIVKDILNVIRGVIEVVTGLITGDWGKVWSGLKTIIGSSLDAVKTVVVTWGKDLGALFSGIWKEIEKLALEGVKKVLDIIGSIPTSFHVLGQKIGFDNPAKAAAKSVQGMIDALNGGKKGLQKSVNDVQAVKPTVAPFKAPTGITGPTRPAPLPPGYFDPLTKSITDQAGIAKAKVKDSAASIGKSAAPTIEKPSLPPGVFGPLTAGVAGQSEAASKQIARSSSGLTGALDPKFAKPTAPVGLLGPVQAGILGQIADTNKKILDSTAALRLSADPSFKKFAAPVPGLYGPVVQGFTDQATNATAQLKEATSKVQGVAPTFQKPTAPTGLFGPLLTGIDGQVVTLNQGIKTSVAGVQGVHPSLKKPEAPAGLFGPLGKGISDQADAAGSSAKRAVSGLQGALTPKIDKPTAPPGVFGPLVQGLNNQVRNVNQRIKESTNGIVSPKFPPLNAPTNLFGHIVEGVQTQVTSANLGISDSVNLLGLPTPALNKPDAPTGLFGPLKSGVDRQASGATTALKNSVADIKGLDGPTLTKPTAPPGLFGPLVAGVQAQAAQAQKDILAAYGGLAGPVGAGAKDASTKIKHVIVDSNSSDAIPSDIIAKSKQSFGASYAASLASAAADGTSKGIANGVTTGAKAGTTVAIRNAQTQISDMKDALAAALAQQTLDIQNSVTQAKQNLNSIGQSLAGSVGAVLQQPLTNLQNKIQASQDKLSLSQLRQSAILPGGKKLSADPDKAIAQLQALANKAGAVTKPAIQAFILQYQQAVLAVKQDQVNATTTASTKSIADLTNAFNKGAITAKQLRTQLLALLKKDGVSYKVAGELLGTAFADGFQGQLTGITKQAAALNAGPKLPGTGQEPTIVQPLLVVQKDARDIAKQQLALAKAQAAVNAKIEKNTANAAANTKALKSVKVNPKALEVNTGKKGKDAKDLVGTS